MGLNLNEKGDDNWGRSCDDNLRLRSTLKSVFLRRWPCRAATQEQQSVPHGKLVAYKSYI